MYFAELKNIKTLKCKSTDVKTIELKKKKNTRTHM